MTSAQFEAEAWIERLGEAEHAVAALERDGALHAVDLPGAEDSLATERTVGEERETVALMRNGQARGRGPMRGWQVQGHLNKGPLAALEGIGEMKREAPDKAAEGLRTRDTGQERAAGEDAGKAQTGMNTPAKAPEPPVREPVGGGYRERTAAPGRYITRPIPGEWSLFRALLEFGNV